MIPTSSHLMKSKSLQSISLREEMRGENGYKGEEKTIEKEKKTAFQFCIQLNNFCIQQGSSLGIVASAGGSKIKPFPGRLLKPSAQRQRSTFKVNTTSFANREATMLFSPPVCYWYSVIKVILRKHLWHY